MMHKTVTGQWHRSLGCLGSAQTGDVLRIGVRGQWWIATYFGDAVITEIASATSVVDASTASLIVLQKEIFI